MGRGLLAGATLAACGGQAARRGRTVVYASGADLQSVNPLVTVHPLAKQVERYVLLTTLVRYDSTLAPRPYLAREWTWTPDRQMLVLRLQSGVRWHDGVATSARDVAWTLNAARDPATGYPRLNDLADVVFVNDRHDSTVVLRFARAHRGGDRLRRDPAGPCRVRAPPARSRGARLPADLPVRDRIQHAAPAVRRRAGPRRRGARGRPPGNRGRISLRIRQRGRRPGASGRARVFARETLADRPRLGPATARRACGRVRAADRRERRGAARADDSGAPRACGGAGLDPPARAHRVSRSRECPAPRFRRRRARPVRRPGAGVLGPARRARRDARPGRSCGGPTLLPRFASGRVSVSRPRRSGHEPPGAGSAHGRPGRAAGRRAMARRAVKRRELPSEFRATAPTRLDFAGGWTDVPPFSAREGGVVVNGCIGLSARVDLKLGGALIRLVSEDLGQELECADSGGLVLDGRLDLVKAALRMFPVQSACTLTTRSDAPPGSGLGSSGALDVALVAALSGARGERLSEREIAEQAWCLETVEAKIPGGKQDQFAAALGGFQRLTVRDPDGGS